MRLFSLTSELHGEFTMPASEESFIKDIESALGEKFEFAGEDWAAYDGKDDIIYVRTGGTEGIFKKVFCMTGKLEVPGYVKLLTSGKSNSLAASMEILSYLVQNGIPAEIVHGDSATIAAALRSRRSGKVSTMRTALRPTGTLNGWTLGVVGKPSDWLISSTVDYSEAEKMLGVRLVDIPMEELISEFRSGRMETVPDLKPLNSPKFGRKIGEKEMQDSLLVYSALKRIKDKYSLDALTIRCFDLLTAIGGTGCMALAILNSEGTPGTCEGDVPAMLSMAVAQALLGAPGFQVNLSQAWGDNLLFAHCTVPLNMVEDYVYDTHFESGIGVAVHGILPEGPATIFKIGSDLTHFIAEDVELVRNQYECNLCRTQVVIKSDSLKDYMLGEPLGNHHVILVGHHAEELKKALSKGE